MESPIRQGSVFIFCILLRKETIPINDSRSRNSGTCRARESKARTRVRIVYATVFGLRKTPPDSIKNLSIQLLASQNTSGSWGVPLLPIKISFQSLGKGADGLGSGRRWLSSALALLGFSSMLYLLFLRL